VHPSTSGVNRVVVLAGGVCTAFGVGSIGSVTEVGNGSTRGRPRPVVRANVSSTGGVGVTVRRRHVGDVNEIIAVGPFEVVEGFRATARFVAVGTVVRGDVLTEHDVTRTGGGLDHRFVFQYGLKVVFSELNSSARKQTAHKQSHQQKGKATRHTLHGLTRISGLFNKLEYRTQHLIMRPTQPVDFCW